MANERFYVSKMFFDISISINFMKIYLFLSINLCLFILYKKLYIAKEDMWLQSYRASTTQMKSGFGHARYNNLKPKPVDIFRRSHPVKFFNNFTLHLFQNND